MRVLKQRTWSIREHLKELYDLYSWSLQAKQNGCGCLIDCCFILYSSSIWFCKPIKHTNLSWNKECIHGMQMSLTRPNLLQLEHFLDVAKLIRNSNRTRRVHFHYTIQINIIKTAYPQDIRVSKTETNKRWDLKWPETSNSHHVWRISTYSLLTDSH